MHCCSPSMMTWVKANKMDTSWCLRLERLQDWCIRPHYPSYSHSGIALSRAIIYLTRPVSEAYDELDS